MADGQHKLSRPIPPAEMAGRACPELSRRTLFGAALVPLILSGAERSRSALSKDAAPLARHPGLGSTFSPFSVPPPHAGRWVSGRARNDEGRPVTNWDRTLACFRKAEAGLKAAEHIGDDRLYDRLLGRLNKALKRLLTHPAPHPAALADKLDLLIEHQVWELRFAEACLAALKRDARRFAR